MGLSIQKEFRTLEFTILLCAKKDEQLIPFVKICMIKSWPLEPFWHGNITIKTKFMQKGKTNSI